VPGNAPGLRHHATGPNTETIKKPDKLHSYGIAELGWQTSTFGLGWSV
jgi:hypothetical protein